jgi:hypothetical protein
MQFNLKLQLCQMVKFPVCEKIFLSKNPRFGIVELRFTKPALKSELIILLFYDSPLLK